MTTNSNGTDEETLIEDCLKTFYTIATIQGRLAYLFMSIHAVNPNILTSLLHYNPHKILWYNMLYGTTLHLYSRPNMKPLTTGHRIAFSVLGSMMFNYSAMRVFASFAEHTDDYPYLMVLLGFLAGRGMMLNLMAYLYHVDCRAGTIRRDNYFDSIYR